MFTILIRAKSFVISRSTKSAFINVLFPLLAIIGEGNEIIMNCFENTCSKQYF